MRTIKFRGISRGIWVYGYLVHTPNNNYQYAIKDTAYNFNNGRMDLIPCEVQNPETIGQFTGLHDKNGKEIYEGDVVEIRYSEYDTDIFKDPPTYTGAVVYYMAQFEVENQDGFVTLLGYNNELAGEPEFTIEVLGNIHENPELLNQ